MSEAYRNLPVFREESVIEGGNTSRSGDRQKVAAVRMCDEIMSDTIAYYNANAEKYFKTTENVDFTASYERFLKNIPKHGSIVDIGCGSGRDVKAFCDMGYQAVGLDASEELAIIAMREKGITVFVDNMTTWIAEEPYDGMWCCASLLHLDDTGLRKFIDNIDKNLKTGGAIYISVKSGIETGYDDKGRYMRNFSFEELSQLLTASNIKIVEHWTTEDKMAREGFCWINVIGIK